MATPEVPFRRPLPDDPDERPQSERQVVVEFLDFYRTVLARKIEGLHRDQLRRTIGTSTLTLGGLIKHLALVEDSWLTVRFAGQPEPEPWASAPFDEDVDWDFHSAADDAPEDLLALYDAACARSRAIVDAAASLDALSAPVPGSPRGPWNLRWILVHLIEEYSRHAGHADLLREAVDGVTGD